MTQFKAFFEQGPVQIVEAISGEQARHVAALIAKQNQTLVKKIKRVKSVC